MYASALYEFKSIREDGRNMLLNKDLYIFWEYSTGQACGCPRFLSELC